MADTLIRYVEFDGFQQEYAEHRASEGSIFEYFIETIQDPLTEFAEILEFRFDENSDRIGNKSVFTKFNKENNNKTMTAALSFLNGTYDLYYKFKQNAYDMSRNNHEGDQLDQGLITINLDVLRQMARQNATAEEIAGRFITEIQSEFPELVNSLSAKRALIFSRGVKAYAEQTKKQAEDAIQQADERTREAVAAKDTADTSEGIAEAITYWNTKYEDHRNARRWMFALFILVLGAGIAVVFFGESLLPGAPGGENGDAGYKWAHYLRVVVVPTLAVAWLLRLISRQFITHLLLQEDARLRQTLVRTFLGLQRNPDAEIADKERAHMLEAIFRPLPVTPNGDVNQPSFADIAKIKQ